ncbi:unnamed protein product [Cuscuta epithymum]|uniref:Rieske domain-containing protein n=1 Tax=Cuscuta epithymum TaxID=186058 RepID=A0AAV0EU29_9ASTE|nr:unnamed protein product [Cuscuta epithymum]CAH9126709.1 unnamed protein product [Cuscuta epithymum]
MATVAPKLAIGILPNRDRLYCRKPSSLSHPLTNTDLQAPGYTISTNTVSGITHDRRRFICRAAEISVAEGPSASEGGGESEGGTNNWVPVVPLAALPKGERRVISQDGETILLLWYKDGVFAIENRSPAEGAYSEGLLNAKLTQDGCIVCPTTDSTFNLRTGEIKEWYPKNPVLRFLSPALRKLLVYPVKIDSENIYISTRRVKTDATAEIVFSGKAQPGVTSTDVNVEEVTKAVR